MRRTTPRYATVAVLLVIVGLFGTGCGGSSKGSKSSDKRDRTSSTDAGATATTDATGDSDSDGSGDDGGANGTGGSGSAGTKVPKIDNAALVGTLNGSGSSFQDVFQQKARTEFTKAAPRVKVNYTKSGSAAGKQDLAGGVVQFAGTDSLISDADLASFKGGKVLYFPVVAAPITVSYNLDGVEELQLSPNTIAGIFQGQITKWNDAKIQADNRDAELPGTAIVVVRRSDGSGTTANFTKWLTAAATNWSLGSGDTVQWPSSTQGAEKSSGVATLVAGSKGAIGYVDIADAVAAKLRFAKVRNAAGKYIEATLDTAGAALEGTALETNLTYDPLNAPGDTAYPITAPTWIVVYKTQPSAAVADALKGYVTYLLTAGQDLAKSVGYARLPEIMVDAALAQVSQISA